MLTICQWWTNFNKINKSNHLDMICHLHKISTILISTKLILISYLLITKPNSNKNNNKIKKFLTMRIAVSQVFKDRREILVKKCSLVTRIATRPDKCKKEEKITHPHKIFSKGTIKHQWMSLCIKEFHQIKTQLKENRKLHLETNTQTTAFYKSNKTPYKIRVDLRIRCLIIKISTHQMKRMRIIIAIIIIVDTQGQQLSILMIYLSILLKLKIFKSF